jgi:hypothetical protein
MKRWIQSLLYMGKTLDNRQVIVGNGSSPGFTNQNQN